MIFPCPSRTFSSQFCANFQPNLARHARLCLAKTLWSNEAAGQAGGKNFRSKFLRGQFWGVHAIGVLWVKALLEKWSLAHIPT